LDRHRLAEERSLAYHAWIAARLVEEPAIRAAARERVRAWIADGSVSPYYATEWARLLDLAPEALAAALVDGSEHARALRQVSPFAGALDPRTRWRLWRETAERSER
jgi:hypothetical protein